MSDTKPVSPIFFKDLKFFHIKELEMSKTLYSCIMELTYSLYQYKDIYNKLLTTDIDFEKYRTDYANNSSKLNSNNSYIFSNMNLGLNYHYKMFLILSKCVLDKLIPLFNYRFNSHLDGFHKKGASLINYLKKNMKENEFAEKVQLSIDEWLGDLIDLRDRYVHHSELDSDFIFYNNNKSSELPLLKDFAQPTIQVGKFSMDTLKYMEDIYDKLAHFVNDVLIFSKYNIYNIPPIVSKCKCGFKFGKLENDKTKLCIEKSFSIEVDNINLKLGHLTCPICNAKYSTDLNFWERFYPILKSHLNK